jgi:hypothetical protein
LTNIAAKRDSFCRAFPEETQFFPVYLPGFAFYLLVFSPTASPEISRQAFFRAIIKL